MPVNEMQVDPGWSESKQAKRRNWVGKAACRLWLAMMILSLLCLCRAGRAQDDEHPSVELDADMRSRVAGVGGSRTALYNGAVQINAELADELNLEIAGGRQYGNFLPQQVALEKQWGANRAQVGLVRLPFGIYDTRETYASGLIDYPIPRSGYRYHSVDWGVPGVSWSGGTPRLQVETALFNGRSSGQWGNQNPVGGGAARLQTYVGGLILGFSRWDGYANTGRDHQNIHMNGVDVRWTRPHLLIRGEYLFGNFSADNAHGAYLDIYYHLPKYQKITLVGRLETLKPGADDPASRQVTLGARYALTNQWILSVNWRRNNGSSAYRPSWTPFAGGSGDFLFQAYYKLHLWN
jgi:hypothetical protein